MTNDVLFTPKEFAQMCKIPRDTLEYYCRIGILPPAKTQENGYGLYSPEQAYTLQMIRLLKLGGCSLKEIREMLYIHGTSGFPDFMEQKRQMLVERRDQCDKALRILDYYKSFRRTTLELATNEMRIVKNPEIFYIYCTETDPHQASDPDYCSEVLREHTRRCEERSMDVLGFPIGRIYSKDSGGSIDLNAISGYCNYCIGVPESMEGCRTIPAANYLTYLHTSDEWTIQDCVLEEVLAYAEERGYCLTEDLYVVPFTEKIVGQSESIYYCRIFAEVEPCEGADLCSKSPEKCMKKFRCS